MIEELGGPGRDRTDDLFHAMECIKPQIIDGTALTSRQNRHNRCYLLPKCCQIHNQRATGLIVWISPILSFPAQASSLSNEATLDESRTHTASK
jgi:hypothetical protein